MNPGGLAVTWVPTSRVARTFETVFPYVWHHEQIMMGSDAPIEVNSQRILERLRYRKVSDYFAASGVDIETLLGPALTGPWRSDGKSRALEPGDINTDLYPRDEFDIPNLFDVPRSK